MSQRTIRDDLRTLAAICLLGGMVLISTGGALSAAARKTETASVIWFLTYGVALMLYAAGYRLLKKWKSLP